MAGKVKKETSKAAGNKPLIIVDPSLPSFDGNQFFEKKAAAAKKLLKKVGLPKELARKANPR